MLNTHSAVTVNVHWYLAALWKHKWCYPFWNIHSASCGLNGNIASSADTIQLSQGWIHAQKATCTELLLWGTST